MALYLHRFGGSLETGDEFVYGWYADSSSSIDAAQGAAVNWISDLLDGAVAGSGLEDLLPTGTVHSSIRTAAIDPATGRQSALRESGISRPGLNAAQSLPADVALVVSLRTTLANRSGRGRFYLPSLSAASLSAGRLSATHQQQLQDSLLAAWNGYSATGSPVVYSRVNRSFQAVTTFDIGDLFDTMRRRESGVAENRMSATMP